MMFWSFLVFAIFLLCNSSSSSSNSLVTASSANETDRLALLAFKYKVDEDPIGALNSWNDSIHFCDWHGVTCSLRHHQRVTVLDLTSLNLQGTLSPHIGNLTFLTSIILADNKFHGEIPQEIRHLLQLQQLNLSFNSFSGDIPTDLTQCSNLRIVDIEHNNISGGIPVEIASLSNLIFLSLETNQLIGSIPSSLGNLTSLRTLSVVENNLTGSIPDHLCRINNLINFKVSLNKLTGLVPSCLYNLSSIKVLGLSQNQLEGTLPLDIGFTLPNLEKIVLGENKFHGLIPLSLVNASRLQMITFEENQFIGQVPTELGRLQRLRLLSLRSNHLGLKTGGNLNFINSLTNCSLLETLMVSDNYLKGSFPNSITNISTQIRNLDLSGNEIYGSIPLGIENLVNLDTLVLAVNNLTGNIPSVIGMLSKMQRMHLNGNQFTGQIPASIGNLSQLLLLDLSVNHLDGRIPPSLGNCLNLFGMDLSNNRLNGTTPKQVIGLSSLKLILNLWDNELSGSLPPEVGNLTDLVWLDVYGNRLSGRIPNTLGNCLALNYLNMAVNFFDGNIPQSLSALKGIETLDLANNTFSGNIPEYLGNLPLLTSLNLSHNELEGQVPMNGVFAKASTVSIDGNNKLCGGITELMLSPCHIQTFNKKGKSLVLKVVIPVIAVSSCLVLLLCFFLMLYRRKLSKETPSSPSLFNHQAIRISYAELHKATNSFSVDNLIGVGGYGSVYKGFLDQVGNIVAVKVLNLQQRGASKTFLSECNALRNIRHRSLLKIITSCSSVDFKGNDFKALVFEFMPNGNLEEWLHPEQNEQYERNLTLLKRLNISIDVASALDYLHHYCQPPIVHCDVKPSNVLLDDDMKAHVADFGLSKIFSATSDPKNEGSSFAIKGSIGYVPPEYGMGSEVSMQGDVYSYGILLLEMFTGKRPTDSMFQNGLSLHNFAKLVLHEQMVNTLDPKMLLQDHDAGNESDRHGVVQQCLLSVLRIGVTCSAESPTERMNMGEATSELCRIRGYHQGVGSV